MWVKRWLLGRPLATAQSGEQRLSNPVALAIFSSDPLSSVAYATEEILLVLILAGTAALHYSLGISIVIVGLVAILTASYRQTIFAYPSGGGAYGAWVVIVLIPLLIVMFRKIRWHYRIADWQLALDMYERPKLPPPNIMVMPISGVNRAVVMALDYARERGQDLRAGTLI